MRYCIVRKMKSELEGAPEGVSRNVKGHMTGCEIKPKGTFKGCKGLFVLERAIYMERSSTVWFHDELDTLTLL